MKVLDTSYYNAVPRIKYFLLVSWKVVPAEARLLLFHPERDGGFNRFLRAFHHIIYNSFWNGQFGVHIM